MKPLVSVVLSTYNCSKVLKYAIESILFQTFQDFELLVIGDCCTDDSEIVVNSFGDERVHWHNLEKNFGNQYGPNNFGNKIAVTDYIAYQNHDDIWLPNHLNLLYNRIKTTNADIVHSIAEIVVNIENKSLVGIYSGPYKQGTCLCSTIIMHKKSLGVEWRNPREITLPVDVDFINRLSELGKKFENIKQITAIKFPATFHNPYNSSSLLQKYYLHNMHKPNFMEKELLDIIGCYFRAYPSLAISESVYKGYNVGQFYEESIIRRGLNKR